MKEFNRRPRRAMADINVVPYIDVMLVLLVIFMVTAPMITHSTIDLPSISESQIPKQTKPIEITVKKNGEWVVKDLQTQNTETVGLQQLADTVKAMQQAETERPVVIAADKTIAYEVVVNTMDALQQGAIQKVGLLVKPKGGQ